MRYLFLCNKLPKLEIIHLYYLTASVDQEPKRGLAGLSASLSLTACAQGVGQG